MRISEHCYLPGLSQQRHAHGETTCSIVLSGTLRERVGTREQISRPFSMVLKPLDTEHADDFGPSGVRLLRITLSPETSRDALQWARTLRCWRWTHSGPACRPFLQLARAMRGEVPPGELRSRYVERLIWDTLAGLATADRSDVGRAPAKWLASAREALDDAVVPPRLSDLAALAGVHPVYLARQFRRFYGCSTSGYLHRRRVQRAADLLGASQVPLARVSLAAGFTDQPHMCRIFRRETGLTPRQYQAIAGEVPSVQDAGKPIA